MSSQQGTAVIFFSVMTSAAAAKARFLSPAVSFLVHANGILPNVIDSIPGTGPKGRLLKGDVLKFLVSGNRRENAPAKPAMPVADSRDRLESVPIRTINGYMPRAGIFTSLDFGPLVSGK